MEHLRPFERRVLAMHSAGTPIDDIAIAFRRSVPHMERVIRWLEIPRSRPAPRRKGRAMERRVLALRSAGLEYDEIAHRFRASPEFIRRIEGLGHLRKAWELLS